MGRRRHKGNKSERGGGGGVLTPEMGHCLLITEKELCHCVVVLKFLESNRPLIAIIEGDAMSCPSMLSNLKTIKVPISLTWLNRPILGRTAVKAPSSVLY